MKNNKRVGRPTLPDEKRRKMMSFRILPDLVSWLIAQGTSQGKLVETALIEHYKIKIK